MGYVLCCVIFGCVMFWVVSFCGLLMFWVVWFWVWLMIWVVSFLGVCSVLCWVILLKGVMHYAVPFLVGRCFVLFNLVFGVIFVLEFLALPRKNVLGVLREGLVDLIRNAVILA